MGGMIHGPDCTFAEKHILFCLLPATKKLIPEVEGRDTISSISSSLLVMQGNVVIIGGGEAWAGLLHLRGLGAATSEISVPTHTLSRTTSGKVMVKRSKGSSTVAMSAVSIIGTVGVLRLGLEGSSRVPASVTGKVSVVELCRLPGDGLHAGVRFGSTSLPFLDEDKQDEQAASRCADANENGDGDSARFLHGGVARG
jgi:hypothetical protein